MLRYILWCSIIAILRHRNMSCLYMVVYNAHPRNIKKIKECAVVTKRERNDVSYLKYKLKSHLEIIGMVNKMIVSTNSTFLSFVLFSNPLI